MTPTKVSNFRFPPHEVARWRALAVAQGISLTAWLRNAARNQATFEEEEAALEQERQAESAPYVHRYSTDPPTGWQTERLNNPSTRQEQK